MERSTKDLGRRYLPRTLFHRLAPLIFVASILGCGGLVGSGPSQLPPSSNVSVSVSPISASVLLGEPQSFVATVSDPSGALTNTAVTWSVNGIAGGNVALGTISASGVYTSPAILPLSEPLIVQATSSADTSKTASATVTVNSDISVFVSPQAMPVELGAVRPFTATVSSAGNPNRGVTWGISGSGCSGPACGMADASGNYTAPQILTAPPNISLTATSVADPSKRASGTITVTSSFSLSLTGPASANAGSSINFAATLTPVANSNPSRTLSWNVSGPGCTGTACGTISPGGAYTAPPLPPSPPTVQVTVVPLADSTKAVSIAVTIVPTVTVTVSPTTATVALGAAQAFQATVTGVPNQTVTWEVNGVAGGNATVGTILNSQTAPNLTTYTAPLVLPAVPVIVQAISNALPSASASAALTFTTALNMAIAPAAMTLAIGHRRTLTVQVNNSANQNVTWQVNGAGGGSSAAGQICVAGSVPCRQVSSSFSGTVDYLAPGGVPSPNPVTVTATSVANPAVAGSVIATILPHVVVGVLPGSLSLAGGGQQRFSATVTGTANQQVTWNVSGAGCATAGACGSIDSTGLFLAPEFQPTPNSIQIVATSADDGTQSASATVMVTTVAPRSLLPSPHPAPTPAQVADSLWRYRGATSWHRVRAPDPQS